jgi:hypothetical protein
LQKRKVSPEVARHRIYGLHADGFVLWNRHENRHPLPADFDRLSALARAQEPKKETPAVPAPPKPALTAAELEAKFKTALTNAVMDGRYCTVADGKLGADKADKYTIASVEKTGEGKWTINAKIQYGKVEFTAPVPSR